MLTSWTFVRHHFPSDSTSTTWPGPILTISLKGNCT